MAKYIMVEDAIEAAINGCASWDGGYFPSMDEPIKDEFEAVDDKCIDFVRCGECKHWMDIDNGRQKHEMCAQLMPNWFCADGERKVQE